MWTVVANVLFLLAGLGLIGLVQWRRVKAEQGESARDSEHNDEENTPIFADSYEQIVRLQEIADRISRISESRQVFTSTNEASIVDRETGAEARTSQNYH